MYAEVASTSPKSMPEPTARVQLKVQYFSDMRFGKNSVSHILQVFKLFGFLLNSLRQTGLQYICELLRGKW